MSQKAKTGQVIGRHRPSSSGSENKAQRRESKIGRNNQMIISPEKKLLDRDRAEQAEQQRLSKLFDPKIERWARECRRWSTPISTMLRCLQEIIKPGSIGWTAIKRYDYNGSLRTDEEVDAAYEEAALLLHPYELQQRGASAELMYVCGCVLDLLDEAHGQDMQRRRRERFSCS